MAFPVNLEVEARASSLEWGKFAELHGDDYSDSTREQFSSGSERLRRDHHRSGRGTRAAAHRR